MTAIQPVESINSPEAAIAALEDCDRQIRYYAAGWLGKHQVHSALEPLCAALRDDRSLTPQDGYALRRQAARSLGLLKNPQAVPVLIEALACEDFQLREASVRSLMAIADNRAVPPLLALLESGGEQPYESLIEALASFNVWSVRPQIELFLQHPSERVQCAAARYLYSLTREPPYIERIIKNLSHNNLYLRKAAAFDLEAIGYLEAAKAMIEAKIPNSVKLSSLKSILIIVLEDEAKKADISQKDSRFLMRAIDDLLMQL